MELHDLQEAKLAIQYDVVFARNLPYAEILDNEVPFIDLKTNVLVLSADAANYDSRINKWTLELAGDKRSIKTFIQTHFPYWRGQVEKTDVWPDKNVKMAARDAKRINEARYAATRITIQIRAATLYVIDNMLYDTESVYNQFWEHDIDQFEDEMIGSEHDNIQLIKINDGWATDNHPNPNPATPDFIIDEESLEQAIRDGWVEVVDGRINEAKLYRPTEKKHYKFTGYKNEFMETRDVQHVFSKVDIKQTNTREEAGERWEDVLELYVYETEERAKQIHDTLKKIHNSYKTKVDDYPLAAYGGVYEREGTYGADFHKQARFNAQGYYTEPFINESRYAWSPKNAYEAFEKYEEAKEKISGKQHIHSGNLVLMEAGYFEENRSNDYVANLYFRALTTDCGIAEKWALEFAREYNLPYTEIYCSVVNNYRSQVTIEYRSH